MMIIGERIKSARQAAGMTQKELASRLGLATRTVQQYELGKRTPRIDQLQNIANALGVTMSELMGLVDNISTSRIYFECDRMACSSCNSDCHHTANIRHAKNFHIVYTDHDGVSVFSEGEYD